MSRTKADWETKLHQEVPSATARANGVTVTCDCGETIEVNFARSRMPPVPIRNKVLQQGWRLTGKKAICPSCQKPEEKPSMVDNPVTALPSVSQTPDARKVHRAVMGWLEEAYNEDQRRYHDGFSDETVAKETGASVQYVAKCREDYFGPLAVPEDLIAIQKALKALDDKLHEADSQARRAVKTITEAHVKKMETLRAEQQAIRDKLETLVVKNGWHQ